MGCVLDSTLFTQILCINMKLDIVFAICLIVSAWNVMMFLTHMYKKLPHNTSQVVSDYYAKHAFHDKVVFNLERGKHDVWESMLMFMTSPYGGKIERPSDSEIMRMTTLLLSNLDDVHVFANNLIKNLAVESRGVMPILTNVKSGCWRRWKS